MLDCAVYSISQRLLIDKRTLIEYNSIIIDHIPSWLAAELSPALAIEFRLLIVRHEVLFNDCSEMPVTSFFTSHIHFHKFPSYYVIANLAKMEDR